MSADLLPLLGLLLGASVASGLRLYATVAVIGFLGRSGALTLPPGLHALTYEWVIVVAAALYLVEFLADKIPLVDSVWDMVHTFIRVPAAGLLAWAALANVPEQWRIIAALCCGGVALSAHGLKSSARAAINTSPEPVTNWLASLAEDGATAFLLYLAVSHPLAAAVVAALVVMAAALLVTWMTRVVRRFFRRERSGSDAGAVVLQ